MSLSKPSHNRELIHQRHIECQGYRRDDGLWDIEGHLVDTKTYSFPNHDRGEITSGEPIHEMWLRLTVDEDFIIRGVEALTDYGPYRICPDATHSFDELKGIQIRPGWRKEINKRVRYAPAEDPIEAMAFLSIAATTNSEITISQMRASIFLPKTLIPAN